MTDPRIHPNPAAVKRRIVRIAKFVCDAGIDLGVEGRSSEIVPVVYGLPEDTATRSALYFGGLVNARTDGQAAPTGMRRNAPVASFPFDVKGTLDVFGFASPENAEAAAWAVFSAVFTRLHSCQSLVDKTPSGVPDGDSPDGPDDYRVQRAFLSEWSMEPYVPVGDTCIARIAFTVGCASTQF